MRANRYVSGFVLAGGHSRRIGCDKAYLKFRGQPLLLRCVNPLKPYVDSFTILGPRARYEPLGVPVLPDRWPDRGPLGALVTGLESSANTWNVFLACDLPLLNGRFIELLPDAVLVGECDAVVPRTTQGWHPLCAAYRRTCTTQMRGALEKGETAIINVLPHLRVDVLSAERLAMAGVAEEVFENINFPEDWQRVLCRMRVEPDERP